MTKEELVNLCKEGDEQALSLLYKTYAEKMKRICSRYISDEQTVNDLLHDGFIIIFYCCPIKSIEYKRISLGHCIFNGRVLFCYSKPIQKIDS